MSGAMAMQILRNHIVRDPVDKQENAAVTIRPSSTALFCVDSDDRYSSFIQRRTNPTYPFTFSITKNQALLNGFFKRLAVTELRMYWTLPNVHQAWGNNTLQYWNSVSNTIRTITMPDGFYDLDSAMAVLQDLIRADGFLPAFICLPAVDGSSSYATGGAPTFYWVAPTSGTRTLYDMLNLITTTAGGLPVPAVNGRGGVANLKPTDYVDIVCSQLTYNQELKDGSTAPIVRDALCRVYLDDTTKSLGRFNVNLFTAAGAANGFQAAAYDVTNFTNGCTPFIIYRQFTQPKQIRWDNTQPLGNLTFELFDDQGRSLQTLWNAFSTPTDPAGSGIFYANSFIWNLSLLVSED